MDNDPTPVDSVFLHEQYLAYIQAAIIVLGIVFFGAALWFGKLEPMTCVVVIIALLNQYTRKPVDVSSALNQIKAFKVGQQSIVYVEPEPDKPKIIKPSEVE